MSKLIQGFTNSETSKNIYLESEQPANLTAICFGEQTAKELAYRYNSHLILLNVIAKLVDAFNEPDSVKQTSVLKEAFDLMKQQKEMKG